mmetsp:Transcript_58088/g.141991  ORF Transcript_58088/g.141991 Transcript_58088/m.141991 type:complete len:266 (-) Transcript_58088:1128-1925(-)
MNDPRVAAVSWLRTNGMDRYGRPSTRILTMHNSLNTLIFLLHFLSVKQPLFDAFLFGPVVSHHIVSYDSDCDFESVTVTQTHTWYTTAYSFGYQREVCNFTTTGHTGSRFRLRYNAFRSDSTVRGYNSNSHPNILDNRRRGRTGCRIGVDVYRRGSGHVKTYGCNKSVPRPCHRRWGTSMCHTGQVPAVPPTGSVSCHTTLTHRCKNRTPGVHDGVSGIVHARPSVRQKNPYLQQPTGDCCCCCFVVAAAAHVVQKSKNHRRQMQ